MKNLRKIRRIRLNKMFWQRIRNIWAWGAYKPDKKVANDMSFAWPSNKKSQFIEPITKKEKYEEAKNISDLLD